MIYDIAIIGAGAGGLMTAAKASECEKSVVLLEGNKKIGKKLLATGNGKCNLSNLLITPQSYFGDDIKPILEKFPCEKIRREFLNLGLMTSVDGEGRVYPQNMQALAVVEALRQACEKNNVQLMLEFNVFCALKSGDLFLLKATDGREVRAKKLVIASGGAASPNHSSSGDGYEIAKSFGHRLTALSPTLAKLPSDDKFIKNVEGVRARAKVSLFFGDEEIKSASGELIFSKKAVSGICVFELSPFTLSLPDDKRLFIKIDLCPNLTHNELFEFLTSYKKNHKEYESKNLLGGVINTKLGREILKKCDVDMLGLVGEISDKQLEKVAFTTKNLKVSVRKATDFKDAQVTSGGVPLDEIDISTFESKKQKGLYFVGEILNVHGNCGGFNLHFAWSSAIIAAQNAAT